MTKIFVGFETIEQAQVAMNAVYGGAAPVAHQPVHVAPQQPMAPAPAAAPMGFQQPPVSAPAPVAVAATPAPQVGAAPSAYTLQNVTAQAQAYAKAHGPKAAKNKLSEFGVTAVSSLRPDQYADAIAALAV